MSPLYPLRVILLAIVSVTILAGAVFCFWTWYDRTRAEPAISIRSVVVEGDLLQSDPIERDDIAAKNIQSNKELVDGSRRAPALLPAESLDQQNSRPRFAENVPPWVFLVGGFALTALSFGGAFPTRLLFANPKAEQVVPRHVDPIVIERPDGSKIHVEVYGEESLPTLVFSHGWSMDNTGWHYAKSELSKRFRVVVWDLPGLGRSTVATNRDQSLEKMANDLDAVIERTCQGRNVVLVGHSIGGMITQVYSRIHSQKLGARVSGIVLVNTTYKNPLTTITAAPLFTALQWPLLVPLNWLVIPLSPLFWLSNWKSYLNGSLQLTSRITSFCGSQSWSQLNHVSFLAAKAWPAVIARGNYAMTQFNEEQSLPAIGVPVLIIAGEADRVTKRFASERMHELIPNSKLAIFPGGHQQLFEYHRLVMPEIAAFVAGLNIE